MSHAFSCLCYQNRIRRAAPWEGEEEDRQILLLLLPQLSRISPLAGEEEERYLIEDLKRHARLAVAGDRHGSPVPRWTLTRYGLDKTPTLLALQSRSYPPCRKRNPLWRRPPPQGGGDTRAEVGGHISPSTRKGERSAVPKFNHHPQLGRTEHPGAPWRVLPKYSEKRQGIEPHAVARAPSAPLALPVCR